MSAAPKRIEAVPSAQPSPDAPASAPQPDEARKPSRWRRRVLMFSVPVLLAAGGGYAWLTGGRYVTTDNAYVQQPLVPVSSDVAGRIVEVDVAENQQVEAGQAMFRLDPEPYRIALEEADAALAQARLSVAQLRSAYSTAQARLGAAQAIEEVRQRELERQESLANQGAASSAALDEATLAARSAENEVTLAQEALSAAAAALGGDPGIATDEVPAVQAALAAREAAARDLAKTLVQAPVPGLVAQVDSLNPGQYVAPGTQVASVVETGDTWIEANFKETQLADLRVGQPVEVEVDAYPDAPLHGTVESLGSATGSQFSLIPAQNATGNWVKVVQRLPVRISVEADPDHPLRGGMSAHVSVDSGHTRLDNLR
ncbi:Membrane fusion component of tripartite multidrug resistance system [Rubellimicrobium mesophilum DSM 19309]|uniref:Membrane fusion component of tripartite multidrug resistance system n=1 Tax=Rubellimicrobium mesophilum DSM 19309 TaxID=442562 RepID=A0A017HKT9_9RHOB|nr:HlyD family secretion protein [Rubellimicrobium mesophilum]EYD74788.1 Membrane fusion component of tripartite multidrug resistance system [Rubellimicrobium mesophilum DSM 19309]